MKRNHYHIMGWDVNTGIPTAARLEDMGIGWVAEELARSRAEKVGREA
jgi:aldehyde:ferredoxin oxidoreductase